MTHDLPNDPLGAFCRENHIALKGPGSGPLAGLTFAAKDAFEIKGARTGFGHPDWLRMHPPATETAQAVQRLLDAGADLVGKTHCDELCYSLTGENVHFGTPLNVNAPGRIPGGSSNARNCPILASRWCALPTARPRRSARRRAPDRYCSIWLSVRD